MEAETLKEPTVGSRRKEYFATAERPFHFVDSGLDNVYLIGIKYFIDEEGHEIAEIPALQQLMRFIAQNIVLSPSDLTGKELKFLRKRLGKKGTEYATYLGVTPETLSRIENEKQAVSLQLQKLARLAHCIFSADPNLAECAKSILEEIKNKSKKTKIILEMGHDQEWRELKVA